MPRRCLVMARPKNIAMHIIKRVKNSLCMLRIEKKFSINQSEEVSQVRYEGAPVRCQGVGNLGKGCRNDSDWKVTFRNGSVKYYCFNCV